MTATASPTASNITTVVGIKSRFVVSADLASHRFHISKANREIPKKERERLTLNTKMPYNSYILKQNNQKYG
jgi:hypothetical protein